MTSSTIDRILDAAEAEFAAHGFVETSVRTITTKAKVNLAAVNYHFGSKKGLINTAYSQSQGHLRKHLTFHYGASFVYFMKLLRKHMPIMSNEQFFWRFHYLLGILVFSLSSSEALLAICEKEYDSSGSLDQIMADIVPVMASAAQAPTTGES